MTLPSIRECTRPLPVDILLLIFQHLVGECATLSSICRTSRVWQTLALPYLLQEVDLGCHNRGRLPEFECDFFPERHADFSDVYRPPGFVARQRAFLLYLSNNPELSVHVRSFTWTLVWMGSDGNNGTWDIDDLNDVDRETWNVFARMTRVTHLDLASLHHIPEEGIFRENPSRLFPGLTHLRLVGWMHRGLVRAIITSLKSTKLRSLTCDYLIDEGALPNGAHMSDDLVRMHVRHVQTTDLISDELYNRQETGKACIYPGPMWYPLRILLTTPLTSMTYLRIRLTSLDDQQDIRSYYTLFHYTAEVVSRASQTLQSLVILFGEDPGYWGHWAPALLESPGFNPRRQRGTYHTPNIAVANAFLSALLSALNEHSFPRLVNIDVRGFRIFDKANERDERILNLEDTRQALRDCKFEDVNFTKRECLDWHPGFSGYVASVPDDDQFNDILGDS